MPSGTTFRGGTLFLCATVAGLLCFLAPVSARANSCEPGTVCFSNNGGTMTGSPSSGFYLNGTNGSIASTITQINGESATGTLSFTLGSLMSGYNMDMTKAGESVYFNPGTLTLTGTLGNYTGIIFNGTFGISGVGVQWTLDSISKSGIYTYTLTGPINGTWFVNGTDITVSGVTTQILFKSKGAYTGAPGQSIALENGSTFVFVPEPATMGLMGTGLLGMGVLVRRKAKRQV
jgi:hypothetical protein